MGCTLIKMDCPVKAGVEQEREERERPSRGHEPWPPQRLSSALRATNGFIFQRRAKVAQLRHFITVTRRDRMILRLDGRSSAITFTSSIPSYCVSMQASGRRLPLFELILKVFDWLIGMCLFLKCCELVNEPWICVR